MEFHIDELDNVTASALPDIPTPRGSYGGHYDPERNTINVIGGCIQKEKDNF